MVTPWNFPLLIVGQKLPFALTAGCTCVVKPSELTSGTTLRLGKILADAGLPDGALNIVSGYGDPVGARMSSPDADMMSFTGSTNVGKAVTSAARENVKKVELETWRQKSSDHLRRRRLTSGGRRDGVWSLL
jgi:betaine-aldehyde dehydrogenase